ncbi:nucleotide sugar dehydrogenase [Endozoicomonas acroporae]|uniref:nucleotide sugar dehydrogenase n=1 Tax=Endozoicomonas acroporae TaxID=1701104 RepID=UPI003D7921DC
MNTAAVEIMDVSQNRQNDMLPAQKIIGVIGCGYVGLPLAFSAVSSGYACLGFDIDESRVQEINSGNHPHSILNSEQCKVLTDGGFKASTDFSKIRECDVVIVCVPTPIGVHKEPILDHIINAVSSVSAHLKYGVLLSLESTTWPGTTEDVICDLLIKDGHEIGKSVYVAYSPEREDPGNLIFSTSSIPKIVSGVSQKCLEFASEFYDSIVDVIVPINCVRTAEMTKIVENIHRLVNIGLVNELKVVAAKFGIDIYDVIEAAKTKPFGFSAYYPGPGVGGHCIPVDPHYLTWKAKEYGLEMRMIDAASQINQDMPRFVSTRVIEALNDIGKAISGSQILLLGLTYKKNIADCRDSPSIEILKKLNSMSGDIYYSDPYLPHIQIEDDNFQSTFESVQLTKTVLNGADIVALLTDHDDFDYQLISEASSLIIDTRGRFTPIKKKILRA